MVFFNFDKEEKELERQLQVFASLEILEFKENNSKPRNEYYGLLMPLYEFESDLGAFAYVGKNEIKIIMITNLSAQQNLVHQILKQILIKFSSLLLNPFFEQKMLDMDNKSTLKDNFVKEVEEIVKKQTFI